MTGKANGVRYVTSGRPAIMLLSIEMLSIPSVSS
jgi:hypothetical protein